MNKMKLSNISKKSGLSREYLVALGAVINYLESVEEKSQSRVRYMTKRAFMHRVVVHYEVYFDNDKYIDVVNNNTHDD